jgi:hypothetical protein
LQVAYEHLENCPPYAETLLTAFEALLSYELWHHKGNDQIGGFAGVANALPCPARC